MIVTKTKITNYDVLLQTAIEKMLAQGYNATTVGEICGAARVSKGGFYHYFKSKEDIGIAALDRYYESGLARMMSGPFNKEADSTKRLVGFLKQTEKQARRFWKHGCLLGTFAVDLAESNPRIRKRVAEMFDQLTDRLAILFMPIAGRSKTAETARKLASGYLCALEGGIVMAKAFDDPGRIGESLAGYRKQLKINP